MASSFQPDVASAEEAEQSKCSLDVPRSAWVPGWRDPLTSLLARSGFEARLHAAIASAAPDEVLSVLWLDVDRFRRTNRGLGTESADGILRNLARRLTQLVDSGDTVARIGGDEFAILSVGQGSEAAGASLAEHILTSLSDQAAAQEPQSERFSVSIGYATSLASECRPLSFVRAAQAALHAAKLSGRGRAVSAARLLGPPRRSREAMRLDLDHAIRSRSLTLAWQPYVEASSGHTVGYEALLRWNRPGYGETSPAVFVPEAEASGLIGDLDAYVLKAACLAGASWRGGWRVNVNVSSYWFALGRIAELVAQVLTETGLSGDRLLIEITERTCIDCADTPRLQIEALRSLGVRIALDDFGTGYSSLATISDLPIDEVKLDRSLIMRVDENPKAGIVLRSILDLARALAIEVCAEGIETQAQHDAVTAAGCDYIQGFLIGRPGPAPEGA